MRVMPNVSNESGVASHDGWLSGGVFTRLYDRIGYCVEKLRSDLKARYRPSFQRRCFTGWGLVFPRADAPISPSGGDHIYFRSTWCKPLGHSSQILGGRRQQELILRTIGAS